MKKSILLIIIALAITSCNLINNKNYKYIKTSNIDLVEKKVVNQEVVKNWEYKDVELDTFPGISLERANNTILQNKEPKEVIIAVLDSEIDVENQEFNDCIWVNKNEIKGNGIDDDGNGYVDDVNGWNFLGNREGKNITKANYEYVRIVRKYQDLFKNKREEDINQTIKPTFLKYQKAKFKLEKEYNLTKRRLMNGEKILQDFLKAKEALRDYFPNGNYTYEKLKEIDTVGNGLSKHVLEIKLTLDYNDSEENMRRVLNLFKDKIDYHLNINFDERELLDSLQLNDFNYGNNRLFNKKHNYSHGTRMTSIVLNKNTRIKGVKVMPVIVEPHGDAHDKDIAAGIMYAVDNGAKVINMSFGKNFSMYPELVQNAIKYAEENNVLIVSSSGNNGKQLIGGYNTFPNDFSRNIKKEISNNFLHVGAITYHLNQKLVASYSNYGKLHVDLFAPGNQVYTMYPNGERKLDRGTSISSALTSTVAALIYAYYPNLKVGQIKDVLMNSGLEYAINIKKPTKEDKNRTIPFNQLSKSGRVLNAYNALIMADSISKN